MRRGSLNATLDSSLRPAGVAYTHQTLAYLDSGIEDRVDLLSNIMDYSGKTWAELGTGIAEREFRNESAPARSPGAPRA